MKFAHFSHIWGKPGMTPHRRYEELWRELALIRAGAARQAKPPPLRPDPFAAFAGYSTNVMAADTMLHLGEAPARRLRDLMALPGAIVRGGLLATPDELGHVIAALGPGPLPTGAVLAAIPEHRRRIVARSLVWLAKFDLVRIVLARSALSPSVRIRPRE